MTVAGPVIGLWIFNLSNPVRSLSEWVGVVADGLRDAAKNGADILVLPEYACESWLHFSPEDIRDDQEVGWMADLASQAVESLQRDVDKTGVGLVAGSMPWRADGHDRPFNRAWTLLPGQDPVPYDKLVLTPSENESGGWMLATGREIRPFMYKGIKCAVLICLDVEMPYLSWLLADRGIDLLIVPSLTTKLSGYNRVFSCAKARAVEMMCAVAVVGCVGGVRPETRGLSYISGAALYLPCEEGLGSGGVLVHEPPSYEGEGAGEIVYAKDFSISILRDLRRGAAEVWPGKWPLAPDIQVIEK